MVSRVRTAESNQDLLAMQREVDAIIRDTLECYDDDAIEEEELAAFGLVLELFNHAIGERSAALQAGTLEPSRVAAIGSSRRLADDAASVTRVSGAIPGPTPR